MTPLRPSAKRCHIVAFDGQDVNTYYHFNALRSGAYYQLQAGEHGPFYCEYGDLDHARDEVRRYLKHEHGLDAAVSVTVL